MGVTEIKTVTLPIRPASYRGQTVDVKVEWKCPTHGTPRGEIYGGFSYDGSWRANVSCWRNDCGCVDSYSDVFHEANVNGLN